MSVERRQYVRAVPDPGAPVTIHITGPNFLEAFEARDISIGGIGIYVPDAFEGKDIASTVQLVIMLPDTRPFLAKAEVRHREENHWFGVEFTEIAEDFRDLIRDYVERRVG